MQTKTIKVSAVEPGMVTACGVRINEVKRSRAFMMTGGVASVLLFHKGGFEICHPNDKLEVKQA